MLLLVKPGKFNQISQCSQHVITSSRSPHPQWQSVDEGWGIHTSVPLHGAPNCKRFSCESTLSSVKCIYPLVLGNEIPVVVIGCLNDYKHLDVTTFHNVATRGAFNWLSLAIPDDILYCKVHMRG